MRNIRHLRNIIVPYYKKRIIKHNELPNKPIYIFYHVYCSPAGSWKDIVESQINELSDSGLLDYSKMVFISIIGSDIDAEWILEHFSKNKIRFINRSLSGKCFEFPCLEYMQKLSFSEEFYALYIHSKGSSYQQTYPDETLQKRIRNISAWRNVLMYYNVKLWRNAIYFLNHGYDSYGCLLMDEYANVKKHYSGNFWWTTSSNCKNCNEITADVKTNRWEAEQWIINDKTKPYCPFYCWSLLYDFHINSSTWENKWYNISNIRYCFNHWFEGRKHLLY